MAKDDAPVLASVGPRLRALRRRRGLTLTRLTEVTGISVSTLSRLESGGRKPTLELLLPLTRAYGVSLDELVGTAAAGKPRGHVVRHGATYQPLTRWPGGVRAVKQTLPPGPSAGAPCLRRHEGYEWLYVLSGRVRLRLGADDLVLNPGEVAEFDTRVPHSITNPGPGPAETLNLFGPQGERLRVRARPRGR